MLKIGDTVKVIPGYPHYQGLIGKIKFINDAWYVDVDFDSIKGAVLHLNSLQKVVIKDPNDIIKGIL